MRPDFKLLPRFLVHVRRSQNRGDAPRGGQRDGTPHRGLRTQHRLDDLLRRGVDDLVVVRLQADPDVLSHGRRPT